MQELNAEFSFERRRDDGGAQVGADDGGGITALGRDLPHQSSDLFFRDRREGEIKRQAEVALGLAGQVGFAPSGADPVLDIRRVESDEADPREAQRATGLPKGQTRACGRDARRRRDLAAEVLAAEKLTHEAEVPFHAMASTSASARSLAAATMGAKANCSSPAGESEISVTLKRLMWMPRPGMSAARRASAGSRTEFDDGVSMPMRSGLTTTSFRFALTRGQLSAAAESRTKIFCNLRAIWSY